MDLSYHLQTSGLELLTSKLQEATELTERLQKVINEINELKVGVDVEKAQAIIYLKS